MDSIQTVEISDAELDNVSGGLNLGAVTGLVDSVVPVSGTVATVVDTVQEATGVSLAPVTNLVAGL